MASGPLPPPPGGGRDPSEGGTAPADRPTAEEERETERWDHSAGDGGSSPGDDHPPAPGSDPGRDAGAVAGSDADSSRGGPPPPPGRVGNRPGPGDFPAVGSGPPRTGRPAHPSTWRAGAPSPGGTDGVAITALVTGILAVLAAFVPLLGALLSLPLAVAAIVSGVIAVRRGLQRGFGITGIATGVAALVITAAWFLLLVVASAPLTEMSDQFPSDLFENMPGAELDPAGAGGLLPVSPCAVTGTGVAPDIVVTGGDPGEARVLRAEACPDSMGDVLLALEVENDAGTPQAVDLEVTATSGTQVVTDGNTVHADLPAGTKGWLRVSTFDDFVTPETVEVALS